MEGKPSSLCIFSIFFHLLPSQTPFFLLLPYQSSSFYFRLKPLSLTSVSIFFLLLPSKTSSFFDFRLKPLSLTSVSSFFYFRLNLFFFYFRLKPLSFTSVSIFFLLLPSKTSSFFYFRRKPLSFASDSSFVFIYLFYLFTQLLSCQLKEKKKYNKMKYNKNWGKIDTIRDRTTEQDSKLSAPHDFYYFRLNLLSSTSVSNLFLLLPSQSSFFYFPFKSLLPTLVSVF